DRDNRKMAFAKRRDTSLTEEKDGFSPDASAMRRAISAAREGIQEGESPFGACIVLDGDPISVAHNQVWGSIDITQHAEIVAISEACRRLGSPHLTGAVLYSTCEPCPMCFSACHWADLQRVVCGAEIADAAHLGFRELTISNRTMKRLGGSDVEITAGFLRDECLVLFDEWLKRPDRKVY
ncbi:MAG TPA: nucleoside deaminase, partial [Methanomicrobiales archaeon]|nr:nucleoside deaminase [Methanomicrobiales archaeon]